MLAPAARAMVVLQYVTTGAVFESASIHGWTVRMAGVVAEDGRPHYEAVIEVADGLMAAGRYATPGPACVKAYLGALKLSSGGSISIVPHPKDRFMYPVVLVHTAKQFGYQVKDQGVVRDVFATGTFAVLDVDVEFRVEGVPDDLVILEREPSPEEIDASVAMGILPAPRP